METFLWFVLENPKLNTQMKSLFHICVCVWGGGGGGRRVKEEGDDSAVQSS